MDFLLAAKMRYYSNDNSKLILSKLNDLLSKKIDVCRPELLCIFEDMINMEPCYYWNRSVFEQTEKSLQDLAMQNAHLFIDDEIFELFLAGYNAYMQITNVINDLSGINDSPAIKNRQYRIPTYISIVEGCLTNLYHFITLIINQTSDKDYASTYKLKALCDILNKNGFSELTNAVNINIRNAINHGGIVFKEDGRKIDFHYTQNGKSVTSTLNAYEIDQLINNVYDTASAIILGIAIFLNNNWSTITVNIADKTFASFSLFGLELSIPSIRCRYISEVSESNQLNAEFWVADTDRQYLIETALVLSMMIFSRYGDYERYYLSFSSMRLATSWVRFTNRQVSDMLSKQRELAEVIGEAIKSHEVMIFNPSTEPVDLQEIKYFRFPNYQCDSYTINKIEDASTPDRKRLRCHLYIGDIDDKQQIIEILRESIEWLKTVRNVDSPTIHHKNGDMEADALYITVYRYDARKDKELYPNNPNFVCFVDYNLSGSTTLLNGGLPANIWSHFYHEKVGNIDIAWREGRYFTRHIQKIGANSLCPCGSGKKFKKCCRGKGIFD